MSKLNFISFTITLLLVWIIFSGEGSASLVTLGLLSVIIVIYVSRRTFIISQFSLLKYINIGKLLAFIPYLLKEIVMANWHVAKLILTNKINPSLLTIPNPCKTDVGEYILAVTITITPGTLIVEYSKEELLVHTLDKLSRENLADLNFCTNVANLEHNCD